MRDPRVAGAFDAIPEGAGAIGLLSSDEFLPQAAEFDRALLAMTGPTVGLILAADARAAPRSERLARAHYRSLGAETSVVDCFRREEATPDRLPGCDVVFIAGGSPAALLECLRDTPLAAEMLRRWRAGECALAGSSAGAMALCTHSLVPEPGAFHPTRWARGLGPLERVALAVHASSRERAWLASIAAGAPVPVVALADATGVILASGRPPQVAGPGDVWIV